MAFSAKLVKRTTTGSGRLLIYEFNELATDTGGDIDCDIGQIQAVVAGQAAGTAVAITATFAGSTVTVAHAAGPTKGYVFVYGIG